MSECLWQRQRNDQGGEGQIKSLMKRTRTGQERGTSRAGTCQPEITRHDDTFLTRRSFCKNTSSQGRTTVDGKWGWGEGWRSCHHNQRKAWGQWAGRELKGHLVW